MGRFGFHFDSARCTGCKTCVLACKDFHNLGADIAYRKVIDYEGGTWTRRADGTWDQDAFVYHLSIACNHCSRPVCVEVCPTSAMHREGNGVVRVNTRVCVGCGYCALTCPYRAPHISSVTNTSAKCDGCFDRLANDLAPICVEACPVRALDAGDIDALEERYGTVRQIDPLPEEALTNPNLIITVPPAFDGQPCARGAIANPSEIGLD